MPDITSNTIAAMKPNDRIAASAFNCIESSIIPSMPATLAGAHPMQSLSGRENKLPNSTCIEGYTAAVLRELTSSLRFCAKATGTRNESGAGAAPDGRKIGPLRQGRASHKLTAAMTDRGRVKMLSRHHTLGGHRIFHAVISCQSRPITTAPQRERDGLAGARRRGAATGARTRPGDAARGHRPKIRNPGPRLFMLRGGAGKSQSFEPPPHSSPERQHPG